jgi:hypothetical protein
MKPSDITGEGHGDKHIWRRGYTNHRPLTDADKFTRYHCEVCGDNFHHYYALTTDIFTAMAEQKVPEKCMPNILY